MFGGLGFKLIFLAAIAAAIGGVFWYQDRQISQLTQDLQTSAANQAKLEAGVELQRLSIRNLERQARETQARYKELTANFQEAETQRTQAVNELQSYRGRLSNAALRRPTLIERRANDAIANLLRAFADSTTNRVESSANAE